MLNNFPLLLTLLICILVLWIHTFMLILVSIQKDILFSYQIKSKKTYICYFLFAIIFMTFLYYLLSRIASMGFYFNIYQVYNTVNDWFYIVYNSYNLNYSTVYLLLYPIFLSILILSIVVFWAFLEVIVTDILKRSMMSLYMYALKYEKFEFLTDKLFDTIIDVDQVPYKLFKNYPKIMFMFYYLWRIIPPIMERFVYHSFPVIVVIFDIYTNFGNILLLFYVMPWYYIYAIIRNILRFVQHLILNPDYKSYSYDLYNDKYL